MRHHAFIRVVFERRALAFATNRDALSKVVYNDLAKPTFSAYPPTSWVYNPDVPHFDFDPKKAAEELEGAGWKLAAGQKVRSKDGQPLKLKLLFGPNTSKQREQTAVIAQQAFADVGVDLSIQGMEWGAFLSALKTPPFDWDIQVGGWQATIDPHWMVQIWEQASIPDLNAGAYVSKRVEDLFDQGSKEFDREKRKKIYQEIQSVLTNDLPYVFLWYPQPGGHKVTVGVNAPVQFPTFTGKPFHVGGVLLQRADVLTVIVAVICMAYLAYFVMKTRTGSI